MTDGPVSFGADLEYSGELFLPFRYYYQHNGEKQQFKSHIPVLTIEDLTAAVVAVVHDRRGVVKDHEGCYLLLEPTEDQASRTIRLHPVVTDADAIDNPTNRVLDPHIAPVDNVLSEILDLCDQLLTDLAILDPGIETTPDYQTAVARTKTAHRWVHRWRSTQ